MKLFKNYVNVISICSPAISKELAVFRLKHLYTFQTSVVFLWCQRPRNKGVWLLRDEV